ncbi:MAG: CZB domain-containing protein [Rhodocyclaceae bacterium]|nr:CZB domain-containing protein [Rhodocyclaceae bacterium]
MALLDDTLSRSGRTIGDTSHRAWVELVKLDHILFRLNLIRQILDEPENRDCKKHTECRLGQWYYGNVDDFGNSPSFKAIEQPHILFHELACQLLNVIGTGNRSEIDRMLVRVDAASQETLRTLERFAEEGMPPPTQAVSSKVELF